jgi:hypothetical protein
MVPSQPALAAGGFGAGGGAAVTGFDWAGGGTSSDTGGAGMSVHGIFLTGAGSAGVGETATLVSMS